MTAAVWLLIVLGSAGIRESPALIDRFPTEQECRRVLNLIADSGTMRTMRCIQATVVVKGTP